MSLFNFDVRNSRLVLAGGLLALGGGVFGGGCSSGTDLSTIGGFCQAIAEADCSPAIVQACYGADDESLQPDTDSCVTVRSQLSNCNPSGLPYNPNFADGCVAAHQQVYSSPSIDGPTFAMLTQACLPVLNKGGTTGASCSADSDCDNGDQYVCVIHAGRGTCQIPNQIMGGESCGGDPADQCADTFFCESSASGDFCVAAGDQGAKCAGDGSCGDGLHCDSMSNVCVQQAGDGEACSLPTDCSGGFCVGASGASGGSGQCASMLIYAQGGLACSSFTR